MKVKVKLHEIPTRESRQTRNLSAAHDKIQFKSTKEVAEQLNEAVAHYKENGCKGYSAIATR